MKRLHNARDLKLATDLYFAVQQLEKFKLLSENGKKYFKKMMGKQDVLHIGPFMLETSLGTNTRLNKDRFIKDFDEKTYRKYLETNIHVRLKIKKEKSRGKA
jgi:hypothetical protein